jgi:hypothetical protein
VVCRTERIEVSSWTGGGAAAVKKLRRLKDARRFSGELDAEREPSAALSAGLAAAGMALLEKESRRCGTGVAVGAAAVAGGAARARAAALVLSRSARTFSKVEVTIGTADGPTNDARSAEECSGAKRACITALMPTALRTV